MSDPTESATVTAEREAARGLRDAEDMGGARWIAGVRCAEWPSADEVGD